MFITISLYYFTFAFVCYYLFFWFHLVLVLGSVALGLQERDLVTRLVHLSDQLPDGTDQLGLLIFQGLLGLAKRNKEAINIGEQVN